MLEALVLGALGSAALVAGGVVGSFWAAPAAVTAVMLALASGSLIGALAFELFPEAVELGELGPAAVGLFLGAAMFVVIDTLLDRWLPDTGPPGRKSDPAGGQSASLVAFALLAAVTLDGVPENLALGVSLIGQDEGAGSSLALLVAIFVSNLPESLVGAVEMRRAQRGPGFVIGVWTATAVLLTAAVVVGRVALAGVGPGVLSFAMAFAGGAVLASVADTLMPEAYEEGRPAIALATAVGFLVSFVLAG